jgi:hypothetical protein
VSWFPHHRHKQGGSGYADSHDGGGARAAQGKSFVYYQEHQYVVHTYAGFLNGLRETNRIERHEIRSFMNDRARFFCRFVLMR